jgi:hypothetical protein
MSRLPGFGGFVPGFKDEVGNTFGQATAPKDPLSARPGDWHPRPAAASGRTPGFSGYVPGMRSDIGKTYGQTTRALGRQRDEQWERPSHRERWTGPAAVNNDKEDSIAAEMEEKAREDEAKELRRRGGAPTSLEEAVEAALHRRHWTERAATGDSRYDVAGYSGWMSDARRSKNPHRPTSDVDPTKMATDCEQPVGRTPGYSGYVPGATGFDVVGERFGTFTTRLQARATEARETKAMEKERTGDVGSGGNLSACAPGVRAPPSMSIVVARPGSTKAPPTQLQQEESSNLERLSQMRGIPGYSGYARGAAASYGVNYARKAAGDTEATELLRHDLKVARPGKVAVESTPGSVPGYTGFVPVTRDLLGKTFGRTMWPGTS